MNKLLSTLFILTASISVFFIGKSSFGVWNYFSLDSKTKGIITNWEVKKKDSDSFAILANYYFFTGNEKITGQTEFMKPYFLNEISAEKAIKKLSGENFEVFFCKKNAQKNSLQKKFPFQSCIHAVLTLGILVYFLFLKRFLEKLAI